MPKYQRVVLKLSGEVLAGGGSSFGIDPERVKSLSEEIAEVARTWRVSPDKIRELFLGRDGMVNVGTPRRNLWRIPMSILLTVMLERGYSRDQADRMLKAARHV